MCPPSPAGNDPETVSAFERLLARSRLAFPLILVAYLLVAGFVVPRADLDADEGYYCAAAHRVMQGRVPYRDFGYTQTPLLPYVNGIAMRVVGFGFLEQRSVNALWGMLTLVVLFRLGTHIGDRYASLLALWVAATSSRWVWSAMLGKAYGGAGLFLAIAALAALAPWRNRWRIFVFAAAGTFAVGCRLTMAPAVFVLWIALILRAPNPRERALALVAPSGVGLLGFLPFFLADPQNFLFWTLQFHLGQTMVRRGWDPVVEFCRLSPGAVVLIVLAGIALALDPRSRRSPISFLYVAALAGILVHLALTYSYGQYSAPYVPLVILASTILLLRHTGARRVGAALVLFPALNLLGALPPLGEQPAGLEKTAAFVRENTPDDGRILTPFPIIAYEARRDVLPGLEMGKFALTTEMPRQEASRRHLVTPEDLTRIVAHGDAAAIVLYGSRSPWNFLWSMPSFTAADPRRMNELFRNLRRHYRVALVEPPFVVMLPNGSGPSGAE